MPTDETDRPAHAEAPEPAVEPGSPESVRRDITIDAPAEHVWDAIRDDRARRAWLDDGEALSRVVRIDEETAPHRLSWTWWRADEPDTATRVSFDLDQQADGLTRVTVVEQPVAPTTAATSGIRASVAAAGASARGRTARVAGRWHTRLVALELLLLCRLPAGVA